MNRILVAFDHCRTMARSYGRPARQTLWLGAAQAGSRLGAMAALAVVMWRLPGDQFGAYVAMLAAANLTVGLIALPYRNVTATHSIDNGRGVLWGLGLAGAAWLTTILILSAIGAATDRILPLAALGAAQTPLWPVASAALRAADLTHRLTWLILATTCIQLVALTLYGIDLTTVALIMGATGFATNAGCVALIYSARGQDRLPAILSAGARPTVRFLTWSALDQGLGQLHHSLPVLLIAGTGSATEAGQYRVAILIAALATAPSIPATSVLKTEIRRLAVDHSPFRKLLLQSTLLGSVIGVLAGVAVAAMSPLALAFLNPLRHQSAWLLVIAPAATVRWTAVGLAAVPAGVADLKPSALANAAALIAMFALIFMPFPLAPPLSYLAANTAQTLALAWQIRRPFRTISSPDPSSSTGAQPEPLA